eukprot:2649124-Prymnesium_polylepis.1
MKKRPYVCSSPPFRRAKAEGGQRRARIGASARVEAAGTLVFERFDADLVPCGDISVALSTRRDDHQTRQRFIVVDEPRRRSN